MTSKRRPIPIIITMISILTLAVFWLFFAPPILGGKTIYALVNGNSMEPTFFLGDMVILRKTNSFQIGDIAIYQNPQMGGNVIHRIIGFEADKTVLQGDNNTWIDTYQPAQDEMLGKFWFRLPKIGKAIQWVKNPLILVILIFIGGGLLMAQDLKNNQHNNKANGKQSSTFSQPNIIVSAVYGLGFLSIVMFALLVYSFTVPISRNADNFTYEQTGEFSYSAEDTADIFDAGIVQSGDPIFTALTCDVEIFYLYTITGDHLRGVSGTQQLSARILDAQSGWQHTIPMTQMASFNGDTFSSTSTMDLCEVITTIAEVEELTGFQLKAYTLEIIASTAVEGLIGTQPFHDLFASSFRFKFDTAHFYIEGVNQKADQLLSTQTSSLINDSLVDHTLQLPGFPAPVKVSGLRLFAAIGSGISLLGLGLIGFYLYQKMKKSKENYIDIKYKHLIINVTDQNLAPLSLVIDVTSIDDLAKLAQTQNGMILHTQQDLAHAYFVKGPETTYRYSIDLHQWQQEAPYVRLSLLTRLNAWIGKDLPLKWIILGMLLVAVIIFSILQATAAGVSIPAIRMGDHTLPLTANQIKPSECDALDLTNIISGSGTITGTSGNDLIFGSAQNDDIDGGGGNDCILAGDGDDSINGNEGTDICAGGTGTNTYTSCETEIH